VRVVLLAPQVRFARKIAEDANADDAVLRLLPKPTKNKKGAIAWVNGAKCGLPPAKQQTKATPRERRERQTGPARVRKAAAAAAAAAATTAAVVAIVSG
jgi:hypothetical protein